MKENIYAVILAGGEGKRLWPISTKIKGKQLLNLYGDKNMLNTTIDRVKDIIPYKNIYVIISKNQEKEIKENIDSNILENHILVEPSARNTAACITYASFKIEDKNGIMCVFSADHYIPDVLSFQETMKKATQVAKSDYLVTIGIEPFFPSSDFGYIKCREKTEVTEVEQFVEKPNKEVAQKYIETKRYLWNSGIFTWKIDRILKEVKEKIPNTYFNFKKLESVNLENEEKLLKEIYESIESVSIDVAVLEKCETLKVIKGEFEWMDIGNWDTITCTMAEDKMHNYFKGDCILKDVKNTMVYNIEKHKKVIGIGLEDLIIINTEDKVLVLPKHKKKQIEEISKMLEN